MNPRLLAFVFILLSSSSLAQDLSGTWTGNYDHHPLMVRSEKLLLKLNFHEDSTITGTSHIYYGNGNYEHYRLKGRYYKDRNLIRLREDSTLSVRMNSGTTLCRGTYNLQLFPTSSKLIFKGSWKDNAMGGYRCPTVGVSVRKDLPPTPPRKDSIAPVATARADSVLKQERVSVLPVLPGKPQVQGLIELGQDEKDSIRIALVDNGEIDHDVVSVYVNGEPVLRNQKLTKDTAGFYISFPASTAVCTVLMRAESMGSIPPCTALMVVTTRRKKHLITLSSTSGMNGVLELFLKNE
ncbi:MAG: hypothetical protein EOP49_02730 [Sphingobacteriales bacterium]|nr:MAG: hypothetical protein EOP49_02730 [Sphingobacteriales bacterium]